MRSFTLSADDSKPQKKAKEPGAGHNSTNFAKDQLKSIVERIEEAEETKANIGLDIKDIYTEARGNGFNAKIIRKLIAIRKKDQHEREEEEALLALYCEALGMETTPLWAAAAKQEETTVA